MVNKIFKKSGFNLIVKLANTLLFFFILSFQHVLAAPPSVWVTPAVVAVDETVTLTITQDSFSLDSPELSVLKENFRILKQSNSSSITKVKGATLIKKRWVLVLLPLKTGKITIPGILIGKERTPSLSIKVTDDSGDNTGSVETNADTSENKSDYKGADENANEDSTENSKNNTLNRNQNDKSNNDSSASSAKPSTDILNKHLGKQTEPAIFIRAEVEQQPHYVQSQVLLSQKIYHAIPLKTAHLTPPKIKDNAADIVQLSQIEPYYWNIEGKRYHVIERNYALFPKHSGSLIIKKAEFTGETKKQPKVTRKEDPFGLYTDTSNAAPKPSENINAIKAGTIINASAEAVTITILQQESSFTANNWLPAKNITVYRKWSKPLDQLKKGDTVVMKTNIIADGLRAEQLPEIFLQIPIDVKSYPEQAELTNTITHSGVTGIWSQKVTFVPSETGEFTIPELKIPWWNITTEREELAKLKKEVLIVRAIDETIVGTVPSKTYSNTPASITSNSTKNLENLEQSVVDRLDANANTAINTSHDATSSFNWGYFLLPALLFFGYFFFKNRRRTPSSKQIHNREKTHKKLQQDTQIDTKNPQYILDGLKNACLENSPQAVEPLLLHWAKQIASISPSTLEGISSANNGYLRFEVERLSQSLYARSQTNWKGVSLWDAIKKYPYPESTDLGKKENRLKEMYPS